MGKPDPLNLVCFLGGSPLHVCFSFYPHHTDVSNSRTHRDDNRCDTDASLFDRLYILWVLCFSPPQYCPPAKRRAVNVAVSLITIRLREDAERIKTTN